MANSETAQTTADLLCGTQVKADSPRARYFLLAASAAFLAQGAIAYPGVLTWDSKMQYAQALSGVLSDWHPPVMAALWRLLLPISTGGSALFVLHLALYWTGLALVAWTLAISRKPWFAAAALLLGFAPSTFFLATFVHKDVGFAVSLMLAFAVVFAHRSTSKRMGMLAISVVVIALAYAFLVRSNGIFGVGPIIVYAFRPIAAEVRSRLARIIACSIILTLVAIPLGTLINRHVFHASDSKAMLSVILYDMAGIAHQTRDTKIYPISPPPLAAVDSCYDDYLWDLINSGTCAHTVGAFDGVPNSAKAKAWPIAIAHHPFGYVTHRLRHFNQEMFAFVPVRHWIWNEYPEFRNLPHGRMEAATFRITEWLSTFPPTTPAAFLILALSVLNAACRQRADRSCNDACLYLSTSAVVYTLGFAIVGVASMYRYHQFLLTAAPLGVTIMLAGTPAPRRARTAIALIAPYLTSVAAIASARMLISR